MGQTLTYSDVTEAEIETLKTSMAEHGFVFNGNQGEIRRFGADVTASYQPDSRTLTVEVKHAPLFMSEKAVAAKIVAAVRGALS